MTWYICEGTVFDGNNPCSVCKPRVVIDPEDSEATDRVVEMFRKLRYDHDTWEDRMRAVFRELANPTPPKPDEPTGLGAVVEDAKGQRWLRVDWPQNPWCHANPTLRDNTTLHGRHRQYDDIAVVRVLSEGVPS